MGRYGGVVKISGLSR